MMHYCVKVKFGGNSYNYEYKTLLANLKRGDHLLVDSSNGLGIAKFVEYTTMNRNIKKYSWVLAKVDVNFLRKSVENNK